MAISKIQGGGGGGAAASPSPPPPPRLVRLWGRVQRLLIKHSVMTRLSRFTALRIKQATLVRADWGDEIHISYHRNVLKKIIFRYRITSLGRGGGGGSVRYVSIRRWVGYMGRVSAILLHSWVGNSHNFFSQIFCCCDFGILMGCRPHISVEYEQF